MYITSNSSSNIEVEHYFVGQGITVIPLDCVARVRWNKDLGEKLKTLRGKVSRRAFAEKLKELGEDYSHQYIQNLELGDTQSISLELLLAICKALDIGIGQILPALRVEQLK